MFRRMIRHSFSVASRASAESTSPEYFARSNAAVISAISQSEYILRRNILPRSSRAVSLLLANCGIARTCDANTEYA